MKNYLVDYQQLKKKCKKYLTKYLLFSFLFLYFASLNFLLVFNLKFTTMKTKNIMMSEEISKIAHLAKRYKEYILGYAYIPCQDLAIYERAYNKWYDVYVAKK